MTLKFVFAFAALFPFEAALAQADARLACTPMRAPDQTPVVLCVSDADSPVRLAPAEILKRVRGCTPIEVEHRRPGPRTYDVQFGDGNVETVPMMACPEMKGRELRWYWVLPRPEGAN